MGKIIRCVALVVSAVWLMGQASCSETAPLSAPEPVRHWTAYAYDAQSGAWGLGWGHRHRHEAMNQAVANCGRPGCVAEEATQSRCIAVATNPRPHAIGVGRAETGPEAGRFAVDYCRNPRAHQCQVQAVRCSY